MELSATPTFTYLVLLVVSVRDDVLLGADGVSVKLFTQQAEESSDGDQELRTCSPTQHRDTFNPPGGTG